MKNEYNKLENTKILVIKRGGKLCNLQLGRNFLFILHLVLQFMIWIWAFFHKLVFRIYLPGLVTLIKKLWNLRLWDLLEHRVHWKKSFDENPAHGLSVLSFSWSAVTGTASTKYYFLALFEVFLTPSPGWRMYEAN